MHNRIPAVRALVWAAALLLGPIVAGTLTAARGALADHQVVLLLVLVVAAVAAAAGRPPAGLIAAVTTGLAYDFFWTQPYESLRVLDTSDVVTVVLLVLIGAAIEQLGWWAGRQRAAAARSAGYLDALARTGSSAEATAQSGTLREAAQAIADVLGADRCRLVVDARLPATVVHDDGSVTRGARVLRVAVEGLPTDDVIGVPVRVSGHPQAHFAVTASSAVARPTREQCQVAALLARLSVGLVATSSTS